MAYRIGAAKNLELNRLARPVCEMGLKGEGKVKDWKWAQDPKVLYWIIGGLVFLVWVVLQKP